MVAFDLSLGHRMIGGTTNMFDVFAFEEDLELFGEVSWTVVREQSWSMANPGFLKTRKIKRHLQGVFHVKSVPGEGTQIQVVLPLTPDAADRLRLI